MRSPSLGDSRQKKRSPFGELHLSRYDLLRSRVITNGNGDNHAATSGNGARQFSGTLDWVAKTAPRDQPRIIRLQTKRSISSGMLLGASTRFRRPEKHPKREALNARGLKSANLVGAAVAGLRHRTVKCCQIRIAELTIAG
jgi:hypothetical protein